MKQPMVFDKSTTDGHVCFVYDNARERMELVAEYLKQGIAKNEFCVFVTYETLGQVIESFKEVKFNALEPIGKGSLQIFEMEATYLPHGHFAADYMLNNVSNFIAEAKARGFSGLRTAGEMSWVADHPEAIEDAIAYEDKVNSLNQPHPSFVGLCLYPAQKTFESVIEGAMRTHPTLVQHNHIISNPSYQAAAF